MGRRLCKEDGCRYVLEDGQRCPSVVHLDAANFRKPTSVGDHTAKSSMLARHAANTRCNFCREGGGCFISACNRGPSGAKCDCHALNMGAQPPKLGIPLARKMFIGG